MASSLSDRPWLERWGTLLLWGLAIGMVIAFSVAWAESPDKPVGLYFSTAAGIALLVVAAAVELVKYFVSRARKDILQGIKGIDTLRRPAGRMNGFRGARHHDWPRS